MISDMSFAIVLVIAFFLAIGGAVCVIHAGYETDCREICQVRGTEMRRVTNYGCLCQDGSTISNHR